MKYLLLILVLLTAMKQGKATPQKDSLPVYRGKDLGLVYTRAFSQFKIWSPAATEAHLIFYKEGLGGTPAKTIPLDKGINGTWYTKLSGDWKGWFYTFQVKIESKWSEEVPDPYAKASGVNGKRGAVLDMEATNPAGWKKDKSPAFSSTNAATDAVIYELHIRDASIHSGSGIVHKGKYLGLAEAHTKTAEGVATGLAHIKELGVTHVHLLPFFDYNSVDETKLETGQYNWGYDPVNYNIPEGSYSTDPYRPEVRIRELKQMIAAFHKNGLRVVMDVVYNHVANAASSNFEQLVPGYYFRHKADGSFSDATACGNETASEKPMMRKFITESLLYWMNEYHIDGFRFDLMGVHDIETMNSISASLRKIRPDVLLYGEGWTAGASPLPDSLRALKANAHRLNHIAVFSDDIRDGIKGSVFDSKDRGFASGKPGMEESVKFGVVAACDHDGVKMNEVNYSKRPYASAPWNVITYAECHDNNTLWDKLMLSNPEATPAQLKAMHQLALTIVLTSQGIPFLHAGTEFFRSKKGVENSYNAGDSINAIDWTMKQRHADFFGYLKKLLQLRKAHPVFRLATAQAVKKNIRFLDKRSSDVVIPVPSGVVAYTIDGASVGDQWKKILVAFNGTDSSKALRLPVMPSPWKDAFTRQRVDTKLNHVKELSGYSAIILYQD